MFKYAIVLERPKKNLQAQVVTEDYADTEEVDNSSGTEDV